LPEVFDVIVIDPIEAEVAATSTVALVGRALVIVTVFPTIAMIWVVDELPAANAGTETKRATKAAKANFFIMPSFWACAQLLSLS
jgi:hypothetical protein